MCGILGSVGYDHDVQAGLYAQRRRGPDDSGRWADHRCGVALGHRRLSILDTSSAGHQPMISRDGRVVMVFNGEIYNFRQLRAELASRGEEFRGHSDSEVLLSLFCSEGVACFPKLNGIFAAAFWERDTERLYLVRDLLGVKPLYFHAQNGRFAFASEIKALLRGGYCAPSLDAEAVLSHLCYLWSPGTRTIASGVSKVLPGEVLCVRRGGVERRWFFGDLEVGGGGSERPEDLVNEVRNTVGAAVERQMVADVPVGAFLSGGLDSSAVVAFASKAYRASGRLQCFSIKVDPKSMSSEGFIDDLPFAEKVARHLDVDLHVVDVGEGMMDRLQEMIYLLDEPTADPAALHALSISEFARQHGIKVLLSGAGGDDIFSGYRRHFAYMQERWWADLPRLGRRALSAAFSMVSTRSPLGRRLNKAFTYAHLDRDERLARYFLWLDPEKAIRLLSREFRGALRGEEVVAPLTQTLGRLQPGADELGRMLYLECKHFLADHNLNYTDKMGMAAGVEVRVPLLDLELVKLAGRIPGNLKQRGGTGKWIFKRAMEPVLPRNVIYRPKTGFGVPLRRWLRGPLQALVDDTLSHESISKRGVFDSQSIERLRQEDEDGIVDASYSIFSLLCIELWCRQYIDGNYALDAGRGIRSAGLFECEGS